MHSKIPMILSIFIFGVSILIEFLLIWLFPIVGLGGIFCIPQTIFTGLFFGGIAYFFLKKEFNILLKGTLFLFLLVAQTYTQLSILPQDRGSALGLLSQLAKSINKYDSIKFNDFHTLNNELEKVAFIHKYEARLPESFIIIHVSPNSNTIEKYIERSYLLIKDKSNNITFDIQKCLIKKEANTTFFIEYLENKDTIRHKLKYDLFTDKLNGKGYKSEKATVFFNEETFKKRNRGIDIIFEKILNILK